MTKHLHIVNFTVPYPPDYGGVIDLFWKLPTLQKLGVQIHLHCFNYGRGEQKELNKYCASVHYYKRKTGLKGFSLGLPYIVSSRKNEILFTNLLKDDYPILLEGVHSCFLLNDTRFATRKKFVRLHNVEHEYYGELAQQATGWLKKKYYERESKLLKIFEKKLLQKATAFFCVTKKDKYFFEKEFGLQNVYFLPLFLPENWLVNCITGIGKYCLYQADLSVDANEQVALWLMENVFNDIAIPLIVAGKNPSEKLTKKVERNKNIALQANPTNEQMQNLIANAQINILPSFHSSGIKLKLLNALYNGKHCLVNSATVVGTDLENLCLLTNNATETKQMIETYMNIDFTYVEIEKRKIVLEKMFNNKQTGTELLNVIFNLP